MAASPIPATGTGWNTAIPDDGQPHGNDYNELRETKLAVAIRNDKEHTAFATSSGGGEHKAGSAVIYHDDYTTTTAGDNLPTNRPDGATALDGDDAGRLAYDTDATIGGLLYRWDGSAWASLFPVIENNTFSQSLNNAGSGLIDMFKVNASDAIEAGAVLAMGSQKITGVANATATGDAVHWGQFTDVSSLAADCTGEIISLPGGTKITWGQSSITGSVQDYTDVNTGLTKCFCAQVTPRTSDNTGWIFAIVSITNGTIRVEKRAGDTTIYFYWLAIGR